MTQKEYIEYNDEYNRLYVEAKAAIERLNKHELTHNCETMPDGCMMENYDGKTKCYTLAAAGNWTLYNP